MIFSGIDGWLQGEPLVEIRAGKRVIDLHNWASFLGFEYRLPGTLILRFDFDESQGGLRKGARSRKLRIRFDGVSDLIVKRAPLEPSYEGESLSDVIYRELPSGKGSVQVTMMDGFAIGFEAGSVVLEDEDSSPS